MAITVYMDDITVSADNEAAVSSAINALVADAELSGFSFNPDKTQPASSKIVSFNIEFGSGVTSIIPARMAELAQDFEFGNEFQQMGIYGYVESVNQDQLNELNP